MIGVTGRGRTDTIVSGESVPHRLVCLFTVAVLALCAGTDSPAPAAGTPTVARGHLLHIQIPTRSLAACVAIAQYADGLELLGTVKYAQDGRLAWSLLIPSTATLGKGSWYVRCGLGIESRGTFIVTVAGAASGTKRTTGVAPRVVVDKQGFSQRADNSSGSSLFSFGVFLRNTSSTQDATGVYVLVNMVAASGDLVGSVTRTIKLIGAGQTFAFGDSLRLRSQVPVKSLELAIRVGAHTSKQPHTMPGFANVRILPSTLDPGYVGEVDGEIVNSVTTHALSSARLSIVLLNAAGNPVGGVGTTTSLVPSGSRMVFRASAGFNAIPLDGSLLPVISVEPNYSSG
jgi:hypothetical protein